MAYTKYSASQAVARAKSWTRWKVAYCLNFVWNCLDYPNSAGLANANQAWTAARQKVYSGTPPAGAPVYWASGQYGHIALSVGGGYVRSTDWPSKGYVGTVAISQITRAWGMSYRGWSRDYAGKPILGLGTSVSYPSPLPVDLNSQLHVGNLRPGYKNNDVRRFEAALYNYLGGPYRAAINAVPANQGTMLDGYYGTLTQKMCSDAYAKAGLARATYPGGKVLLQKLGFTNVV